MTDSGFLLVDKPQGITSHQVVARARRALGTKKIGHAGTLDPMATGLMLLGIEKGTRLLGHLTLADKAYEATIRLGISTVTDDAEGETVAAPGASGVTGEQLAAAIAPYRGTITQVPSAVSAIKVNGQRAYARVRRGESVELAGRTVTVSRYDIVAVREGSVGELPVLDVDVLVECSSGTYIRALARDLGRDLGTGGHLTALRRTRVGPFTLADATWDAVLPDLAPGERLPIALVPLVQMVSDFLPVIEVDADAARDVGYGRPLAVKVPADPTAIVHDGVLLALYRPEGDGCVAAAVLV